LNYYDDIKQELINNEINRKVKNYSINKSDLNTYYNVGKMLSDAGKHYGEGIIKKYSIKLTADIGKTYSVTTLKYIRKFYEFAKSHSLSDQLTYTHYKLLLSMKNDKMVNYYINRCIKDNLSVRQLEKIIKLKEYERLPEETKLKKLNDNNNQLKDFVKDPIIIRNNDGNIIVSEKILQRLILEDISSFLKELGNGFSFIDNEFKIKLGNNYNYIDLLLFNIIFNCYVVVELKVTELKKEHIGQIEVYMNYIDNNIKSVNQDKTIGIIICKKDNKYVIEYCSDKRIISREYELINNSFS